jgi:hypothetical protein
MLSHLAHPTRYLKSCTSNLNSHHHKDCCPQGQSGPRWLKLCRRQVGVDVKVAFQAIQ